MRFVADERRLGVDDTLVFGRGAELDVDSNPFLHRRMGRLVHREGHWWLQNVGSRIVVQLVDPATGAAAKVPPGVETALTSALALARFSAGSSNYELHLRQIEPERSLTAAPSDEPVRYTRTFEAGQLPLTADQRVMLLAFAEAQMRDPLGSARLPANREVADRLGWSAAKLNRKLDWLCDRLTRQGVEGLHATDGRAVDRRQRLVDHAIESGMITTADLAQLP